MQRLLAVCEPLGTLMPGPRPLEGKSFYLDELKSNSTIVLTKLIIRLGGKVESFLYKDVNVVITGNRDTLRTITASSGKVKGHNSPHEQRESRNDVAQRPGTPLRAPVCGSRGKALLEKAIRNNEQSRGGVLSSAARYWGVKIVSVEQFMKVVEDLSSQHSTHTHRKREDKNSSLCIIKAGSLKVEFVKVEDSSRKYRPLHCQSLDFPMLSYTRRFSPFENPAPVQLLKTREDGLSKDKFGKNEETISSHDKLSAAPSPKMSHKKKNLGYCECCQRKYSDQDEHLRSDVHLRFVEDFNNYAVVDQLMSAMADVFSGCKDPQVDALMMRFSSGSVALPSEIELQCKSEMETCLTNQEVGPASHVQVQQERICDSSVQLQEPCADAPPFISLETKFVDEKRDSSNSETNIPSPRQQHDFILDSKPVEFTTPSPRLVQVADSHKPSTLQEPAEISQRHLPSLETLLNDDNDSATCLKSPKKHQEDTVNDLPPCSWLMEREQTHMVETTSCSPSFHSLPQSLSTRISDGENPRKRSRSFTLSPKASKVRRTSLRSEPTNQNSGVDVRFHHLAQSGINRHTEANDVTQCKRETAEQHPSLNASLNVPTPEDDQQEELVCQIYLNNKDASSELGPPQLYPFFQDDVYQNQPFLEPPKLVPSIPFPSTNKTSSNSHLSQSFSSICIESALVPDTFSPASSESDWDSGLLSLLAPQVHRQPKVDRCELDLGLLLQSPCSGMQDGSYASRLCSVLQPTASSSHTVFGDPNTIYRPIKTMDRRIIQSLGV